MLVKNLSQDSKGNLKKRIIVMAQRCRGLPEVPELGKGSRGLSAGSARLPSRCSLISELQGFHFPIKEAHRLHLTDSFMDKHIVSSLNEAC